MPHGLSIRNSRLTRSYNMDIHEPPPTDIYFDPDLGEMGEWVAISALTGREYIAPQRADAEGARAEDEAVYSRHHRVKATVG